MPTSEAELRWAEELPTDPLPQMAYAREKAEAIVTGLEYPLNNHLLKLAAVPSSDFPHWKNETVAWLSQIAAIRLKPENRPGSPQFYFKLLYDEPFGGVELQNATSRLDLLRLQYGRLAFGLQPDDWLRDCANFTGNSPRPVSRGRSRRAGSPGWWTNS